MYVFILIMSILLQISWPTDLSSSETVVHCFHTLELKIAVRPVRSEPFRDVISMGQSPEIQPERGNVPGLWLIFLLYQKRFMISNLKIRSVSYCSILDFCAEMM